MGDFNLLKELNELVNPKDFADKNKLVKIDSVSDRKEISRTTKK